MEKRNIEVELFDAYLNSEMTEAEKVAFETRLSAEPQLRDALDLYKTVLDSIERNAEKRLLKAKVDLIGKQVLREQRWSRGWKTFGISVLSLLIIVVVVRYFWSFDMKNIPDDNNRQRIQTDTGSVQPFQKNTIKNETRPPGEPVAKNNMHQTPGQEIKLGQGTLDTFVFHIKAEKIIIKDGKALLPIDTSEFKITLYLYTDSNLPSNYVTEGNELDAYILKKQFSKNLRLTYLQRRESQALYLQIGSICYPLPEDRGELKRETDKNILQWLQ